MNVPYASLLGWGDAAADDSGHVYFVGEVRPQFMTVPPATHGPTPTVGQLGVWVGRVDTTESAGSSSTTRRSSRYGRRCRALKREREKEKRE